MWVQDQVPMILKQTLDMSMHQLLVLEEDLKVEKEQITLDLETIIPI